VYCLNYVLFKYLDESIVGSIKLLILVMKTLVRKNNLLKKNEKAAITPVCVSVA